MKSTLLTVAAFVPELAERSAELLVTIASFYYFGGKRAFKLGYQFRGWIRQVQSHRQSKTDRLETILAGQYCELTCEYVAPEHNYYQAWIDTCNLADAIDSHSAKLANLQIDRVLLQCRIADRKIAERLAKTDVDKLQNAIDSHEYSCQVACALRVDRQNWLKANHSASPIEIQPAPFTGDEVIEPDFCDIPEFVFLGDWWIGKSGKALKSKAALRKAYKTRVAALVS